MLTYIFKTFFTIGITSFGGYTSLIAMVKRKMVDKDNVIDDDIIFNGFSLASILPGPVAVNTVTYIGYHLKGWKGAFVAVISVVLPSFLLIIVGTHFYLNYGEVEQFNRVIQGIIPVIIAIIASVAYNMSIKSITTWKHLLILISGLLVQVLVNGYLVFVICLVASAIAGFILFKERHHKADTIKIKRLNYQLKFDWVLLTIASLFLLSILLSTLFPVTMELRIYEVFARISLTLFGGGYVMIPVLKSMIVDQLAWLSDKQFIDAIAFGQITPGPILISATFIGYKIAGIIGAVLATVGIFGPSAFLVTIMASGFKKIENSLIWHAVLQGVKPMIISFVIYSVWIVAGTIQVDYLWSSIIAVISIIALLYFKINYLFLVSIFGVIGYFFL